ncbi:MAG TPA: hypothetical protein VLH75_18265 [Longimicrobiales bacterium]|nr:hypothetical protein [Longimicrobiales bacterium]
MTSVPSPIRAAAVAAALVCCLFEAAGAQQPGPPTNGGRPRVFFDCQGPNCNSDYFRTEIPWVTWVRDRTDAQVHVIVVSTATGAGGRAYEMDFQGRNGLTGYTDHLVYTSRPTDTDRETLDGIAHVLALGLAGVANAGGYRGIVRLEGTSQDGTRPSAGLVSAEEVEDPWNLWAFRVGGSGNYEGESTTENLRLNTSASASRVTPTWKLSYNGRMNFQRQEYERSDSTRLVVERTDWNADALSVYSFADRWSVGINSNAARMTRYNQDFRVSVAPAMEYSFFPYEEATRRSLTVYYEIGPTYRNYITETIYEEMEELRWEESLQVRYSQREPWGDASVALEGSHFLHDVNLYNVALRGSVSVRVARGLSLDANANVSWVRDQLYLSADDESDEEILLRLRQRGTDFTYGGSLGFSFQFGSIFNNVVNNRFRRGYDRGGYGG